MSNLLNPFRHRSEGQSMAPPRLHTPRDAAIAVIAPTHSERRAAKRLAYATARQARAARPGARGWRRAGGGHVPWVEAPPEYRGTTVQVCGLWPFSAGSGTPTDGVPLGKHQLTGATVCGDPDLVVGTLFEADFERHTARLRTPAGGGTVTVTFPPEMADDIQQALRIETQLEGRVRYDRGTGTAASIETRAVTRAEQLLIHDGDWSFAENLSVAELQQRQRVKGGNVNLADLAADNLTANERDAFVAALSST